MAKIKRSVSMILSVLMAASVLTTAPVSAATIEASDAGANVAETQQAELKIAEGSCGDKLTWSLDSDGVLEISGEGKMYDFDFEAKEGENSFNPWTLYRDQIKKVVVKDGVEYIGNFAFFGFAELEEAQIADSVKEVGENAFEGCEKLDKTSFTEPVTEIVTEAATEEETTKKSPIIVKEEEEAVGAVEEEAVGAAVAISKCTITLSATYYTYDGNAKKPSVTVKNGSKTLTKGTDYSVSYKNYINAGTATVTVTGKGGYTGSVAKNYTIKKRAISTAAITLSSSNYIYNGTAIKPAVTATYNSIGLVKDKDFSVAYKNNTNAGTATVTITGKGTNFTGTTTKTFTIQKKSIKKCTVTIDDSACNYTGKSVYPKITVKDGNKVLKIGSDFGPTYEKNIDAGTASVTITGIGNYGENVKKTFKIEAKMISKCTFSANKSSVVYNGTAQKPGVTVKDPDLNVTLKENKDYTLSYTRNINKGTATVYIIGIGNYVSTVWCSFTITAKPLTSSMIKLTPRENFNYSNRAKNADLTVSDGTKALVKGTDYTLSYEKNNTTITVTGIGNYKGTLNNCEKAFVWGCDNWSFNNSADNFVNKTGWNNYNVSQNVLKIIKKNEKDSGLIKDESQIDKIPKFTKTNNTWNGSCYGMSLSSILFAQGYLNLGNYFTGSSNINELAADETSISLINFFQISYSYDYVKISTSIRNYVENNRPVQSDCIKALENEFAKDCTPLLVVYGKNGKPYHAAVAYGVEDYNYTYNSKKYDKRILIYDPNFGSKNAVTDSACIHYNSSDYSCLGGNICSIAKIKSISVAEDVIANYNKENSVGADEEFSNNVDLKWTTLDDLVENENALSVSTKGDVNSDGSVDVSDANAIQMYLAGITELSDAKLIVADANNDGVVSVDDSLYIQLMLAELV